jgi:hypothetical protein
MGLYMEKATSLKTLMCEGIVVLAGDNFICVYNYHSYTYGKTPIHYPSPHLKIKLEIKG